MDINSFPGCCGISIITDFFIRPTERLIAELDSLLEDLRFHERYEDDEHGYTEQGAKVLVAITEAQNNAGWETELRKRGFKRLTKPFHNTNTKDQALIYLYGLTHTKPEDL